MHHVPNRVCCCFGCVSYYGERWAVEGTVVGDKSGHINSSKKQIQSHTESHQCVYRPCFSVIYEEHLSFALLVNKKATHQGILLIGVVCQFGRRQIPDFLLMNNNFSLPRDAKP